MFKAYGSTKLFGRGGRAGDWGAWNKPAKRFSNNAAVMDTRVPLKASLKGFKAPVKGSRGLI